MAVSSEKTFGGPRNSFGMKRRKNASMANRPSFVRRSARTASRPSNSMDSVWLASSKSVRKDANRSFQHQHEEALFGEIGRGVRVKPAGAILDGIEPVGRDRLTDRKRRPINAPGAKDL